MTYLSQASLKFSCQNGCDKTRLRRDDVQSQLSYSILVHRCVARVCLVGLILFFSARLLFANAASELSLQQAIQIVKGAERQVSVLEWTVESSSTTIPPKTSQAVARSSSSSKSALYDFNSRYYRSLSRRLQTKPNAKMNGYTIGLSFNGKVYNSLWGYWTGDSAFQGDGIITDEIEKAVYHNVQTKANRIVLLGLVTGMPGAVYTETMYPTPEEEESTSPVGNVRLSDTLVKWQKNGYDVSVVMKSEEQQIHFVGTSTKPFYGGDRRTQSTIVFDIQRGAVISAELNALTGDGIDHCCKWQVEFDSNVEATPTTYRPLRIIHDDYGNYNRSVFDYKSVEVNPKRTAQDYTCAFPNGTLVEDTIQKMLYTVGSPMDTDQAVGEFMKLHGLTGDVPKKTFRNNAIRFTLIGAGLILIGIAIYQMLQKRRRV